jgi:hypothetical protein
MPDLLTLTTNLKSLRFGNDTPGGGSSNQPYIQTPIPDQNQQVSGDNLSSPDFLLRGGMNSARDTVTDVVRLTKYFTDLKSPSGVLFASKQNSLSAIAVRTQASKGALNEGAYTPLSTLAQAGVNFIGGHIDKQGLDIINGINTYSDELQERITVTREGVGTSLNSIIGNALGEGNRLVDLTTEFNTKKTKGNELVNVLSYRGGPNSNLGLGTTYIKIATDASGVPLVTGANNPNLSSFFPPPLPPPPPDDIFPLEPVILGSESPDNFRAEGVRGNVKNGLYGFDIFKGGSYTTINAKGKTDINISDFRREVLKIQEQKVSYVGSIAPSYKPKNGKTYEGNNGSRVGITSPGLRGDRKNYTAGKIIDRTEQGTGGRVSVVDEINFQPIYQSKKVREDLEVKKNDLVKFRIAAINQSDPNLKQFIHFRAFINSFTDNYGATWNGQKYMGRGEQFYKYDGFTRDINMSFTMAAQSKPELMAQYKKLNFLASNLAPIYSGAGYLGGPLIQLTMGGWCYELPGFIETLNLEIPQESTWEIGIDSKGESDHSVKEMPHICNVTMKFTPIHTFRPEKQKLTFGGDGNEVATYGSQRYLELTNGYNNNYVPVSLAEATNPRSKVENTYSQTGE